MKKISNIILAVIAITFLFVFLKNIVSEKSPVKDVGQTTAAIPYNPFPAVEPIFVTTRGDGKWLNPENRPKIHPGYRFFYETLPTDSNTGVEAIIRNENGEMVVEFITTKEGGRQIGVSSKPLPASSRHVLFLDFKSKSDPVKVMVTFNPPPENYF